jgi:hypothetical protein
VTGIAIVATAGSATANSYADEAAFIAYAATRLNVVSGTTVSGSTCSENEKKALIEATRDLTKLLWEGSRADTTQILSWPRKYAIDPDKPTSTLLGDIALLYFDSTIVPQRIKDATCELALEYLKAGTTDIAAQDSKQNVIQKTIGPISTTYSDPWQRAQGLARFPRVVAYIAPLLDSTGTGGLDMVRV